MKKKFMIIFSIILVVVLLVIFKVNVYDTSYYTVSWGKAQFHIPENVIKITYVDPSISGNAIVFDAAEEVDEWKEFIAELNNTPFTKENSTMGSSFVGAIITLQVEGIEETLQITFADSGQIKFNNYSWIPSSNIELPFSEEELKSFNESETEEDIDSETDTEDGKEPLSQDKLEWFETSFFNNDEESMVNMFLTSEYASPTDINLGELFYDGTLRETNVKISDKEIQLLEKQYGREIDIDISKTPVEDMDALLQKYMNITLDDTKKVGIDGLYYLEEYKAYYNIAGDTHWVRCEIGDGWMNDDGTIVIQYVISEDFGGDGTVYQVTLEEENENYYFVSNLSVK